MGRATGPRNKERGYEHEVELVKLAQGAEFTARRAWGSNGASLGLPPGVDVEILVDPDAPPEYIQAKRQKVLPKGLERWLEYLRNACSAVVFRKDRDRNFVIITWDKWVALQKDARYAEAMRTRDRIDRIF